MSRTIYAGAMREVEDVVGSIVRDSDNLEGTDHAGILVDVLWRRRVGIPYKDSVVASTLHLLLLSTRNWHKACKGGMLHTAAVCVCLWLCHTYVNVNVECPRVIFSYVSGSFINICSESASLEIHWVSFVNYYIWRLVTSMFCSRI